MRISIAIKRRVKNIQINPSYRFQLPSIREGSGFLLVSNGGAHSAQHKIEVVTGLYLLAAFLKRANTYKELVNDII